MVVTHGKRLKYILAASLLIDNLGDEAGPNELVDESC